MPAPGSAIGIVTDVVALDLSRAFEQGSAWGLRRFALRRASSGRFPHFDRPDIHVVEAAVASGTVIPTVMPGILQGPVEDRERLVPDLEQVLPRALDLARQFGCGRVAAHGFERYPGEPEANRLLVLRAFERVAEAADAAGVVLTVTNAPGSWVDRPKETAALLRELDHPSLRVSWDPARALQGGHRVTEDDVEALHPFLAEVLVQDGARVDDRFVRRPVGDGQVPWPEILHALHEAGVPFDLTLTSDEEPGTSAAGRAEEDLERLAEMVRDAGLAPAHPDGRA